MREVELALKGVLGHDVSGIEFANQIDKLNEQGVEVLNLRICSEGGSVFDGYHIVSSMLAFNGAINVFIDFAASMAGVIAVCGTTVNMSSHGILHIHAPYQNGEQTPEVAKTLAALKESLMSVYESRRNISPELLDAMFGKETYMTAKEAKKEGFVDNIYTTKSLSNKQKRLIQNAIKTSPSRAFEVYNKIVNEPMSDNTENQESIVDETENNVNTEAKTDDNSETQTEVGAKNMVEVDSAKEKDEEKSEAKAEVKDEVKFENKVEFEVYNKLSTDFLALRTENDALKAKLAVYEEKEAAENAAKAASLVDNAITEGKIVAEAKATWLAKATANLSEVEALLASIPSRVSNLKNLDIVASLKPIESTKPVSMVEWEKQNPVDAKDFTKWKAMYKQLTGKDYPAA